MLKPPMNTDEIWSSAFRLPSEFDLQAGQRLSSEDSRVRYLLQFTLYRLSSLFRYNLVSLRDSCYVRSPDPGSERGHPRRWEQSPDGNRQSLTCSPRAVSDRHNCGSGPHDHRRDLDLCQRPIQVRVSWPSRNSGCLPGPRTTGGPAFRNATHRPPTRPPA